MNATMRYSETQVLRILTQIGVSVQSETETDFIALCPFHNSVHTPAFCVSKRSGVYYCHNAACGASGTFPDLIKSLTRYSDLKVEIMLHEAKSEEPLRRLVEEREAEQQFPTYSAQEIERLHRSLFDHQHALDYMVRERKIDEITLERFKVGYDAERDMITVPMYDEKGSPLGLVRRGVADKVFKNTYQLPKRLTLWNIHNAKKYSSVIVTEATFDAMSVHQAGFPGVVAALGNSFSASQAKQIDKYFSKIILMVDDDEGGNALGMRIAKFLPHKTIVWASLGRPRYRGVKDANKLSRNEISEAIGEAEPHFEY